MTYTQLRRRAVRVTSSYDVTGADPMQADWSERVFVPDFVLLTDHEGHVSYRVTGVALKKDGTPSLNQAHSEPYRLTELGAEPEWLQNLVRDYCAEAEIEVPS